ncbi:ABC transporter substrate-binding protein [Streptoalloteichus hindustanus]|uniref:Carbohydrate ABC transporter substrate-binding protein, CUT1 family n=1 Tax=Streptoalloteichus hindustanus TaxID=2017 RepID=A0A1M5J4J5_STRHI|nr:ABC transporter substrate-binding protein [Streptoalloteichus hindustanus]SHG35496.1 carbohydrate ABC transporter substrate-binding protein, CUT1 family [Streptoalloteichus hindustanus]
MGRPTRGGRRAAVLLGAALLVAPALAACGAATDDGIVVNLYNPPEENLSKVVETCNQRAGGRYRIALTTLPRGADGQREQMVRRLAAGDTDMDVLNLDITWTPEFAEAGWIREWTGRHKEEAERDVLPGPLASTRWRGRTYAAAKNSNVQLLWYRSDLVEEPPTTWQEVIRTAQELQQRGKPGTVLLTGAQYEGLVVNYSNMVGALDGHILSEDGSRAVLDDGAVRALETLRDLARSGVTSPSLTNQREDDVRLGFQSGNAAFQVNWPFVHPATRAGNPQVFRNMKWAPLPGVEPGKPGKATIGGANYTVSSYSRHPDEAFDAVLCLRDAANQKFQAVKDGLPPTLASVYDEPEMAEAYPMRDVIREQLRNPALRPMTPAYQNVSTVLSTVLSPPSAIDPKATADRLRKELQDAIESKGVLP